MKYDDTTIAERYVSAREIPVPTMSLWINSIKERVSIEYISTVFDVGCGTGRFSAALADLFDASVIGIDPSLTMLAQAQKNVHHPKVYFLKGHSESLPAENATACLLFLSMVYHHIEHPEQAAKEFFRVLRPGGFVCIRNSTQELLNSVPYLKYFPEALRFNRGRIPAKHGIIKNMNKAGLSFLSHDVVKQKFADTLNQYCEKIAQRGLSDLEMLSDSEFDAGVDKMKRDAKKMGDSGPIMEPIDLFVFKKETEQSHTADA
jgi:ubiquinone/menaquinone biosynthesis C-methylase UbiE